RRPYSYLLFPVTEYQCCPHGLVSRFRTEKEFIRRGFDVVDSSTPADVFVINTCTVTQSADSDCRQIVRRALRNSPDAYVVVTGCYAQGKPDEIAQIEGVDLVLGANEKFKLFDFVDDFAKNYHARIFAGPVQDIVEFGAADSALDGTRPQTDGPHVARHSGLQTRTRAFLKVQDGCNYNCSYCTIPTVRGKSRSPSIDFLIQQVKEIAANGFKEVVLSGVNVGDYGRPEPLQKSDDGQSRSFLELLKALEDVGGIERFRISSMEPNLLTKEIVEFVASSAKFCKHFHVPLQSGSDEILRKMRRRYNSSQYRDTVEYVKELIPEAGIGADIIVGFPGETNEAFERSYNFVENLPLSYLHVFSYSERGGTDASGFHSSVDPRVRRKRSEVMRMLSARKRYEFNRLHVGKIVRVLIEDEVKNGEVFGFTSNYVRVEIPLAATSGAAESVGESNLTHANEISDVLITGISDNTVLGQVIL
ncbi:MAG: tRNA (N(6)-L-threonylcarbamoyladenosine(37)-C(2))-methylthiotransferase MtaB, partial [Bacteroidetes bacterium]|nr:tRNA (N(6)-L-threonylcarbamoyladenosine(37)-C(2))-methylthiotransferase MtaB [Bacteroidota bacterium]